VRVRDTTLGTKDSMDLPGSSTIILRREMNLPQSRRVKSLPKDLEEEEEEEDTLR